MSLYQAIDEGLVLGLYFGFVGLMLSSSLGQQLWEALQTLDTLVLVVGVPMALTTSVYWLYGGIYCYIDFCAPALWKHKIQKRRVSKDQYLHCVSLVLLNMLIVNLPLAYLGYHFEIIKNHGIRTSLPNVVEFGVQLGFFTIVEEIGFYYSHWLFHHPAIYKYVHKIHHSFPAPVGIASIYAHPLEHLVANMLPIVCGPPIFESIFGITPHIVTCWLWYTTAILVTITSHSGYKFFGFPSSLEHDFHHYAFKDNYGSLGLLDYLHGTNRNFIAWKKSYQSLKEE
ncbi:hypothetical protein EDD86DRAFT_199917 [Gorgonomyces haynaldii]|nr:hypothetical protein EDD86DRAFT_199917 [Gorgonomyces haynaldii]